MKKALLLFVLVLSGCGLTDDLGDKTIQGTQITPVRDLVAYTNRVLPLMKTNCATCHVAGGVATNYPFAQDPAATSEGIVRDRINNVVTNSGLGASHFNCTTCTPTVKSAFETAVNAYLGR